MSARLKRIYYGVVAQLGERLNGIQEVRGSIPLSSTIKTKSVLYGRFLIFKAKKGGIEHPTGFGLLRMFHF